MRRVVALAVALCSLATGAPSLAADLAENRANVAQGERLLAAGKKDAAKDALMKVVEAFNDGSIKDDDAEGLALVGRAAMLLGHARDANDAFNRSERATRGKPPRVQTLLWRGELFLDEHDPGHAEEVAKEALAAAPDEPRAHVLLARVKLEQTLDFDAAEREANAALARDPGLAAAHAVKAGLALHTFELADADREVSAGLAAHPGDRELLAMKAAVRFLDDDRAGFEAAKRAALAASPGWSGFYRVVGEYADWEHRYDDIVAMMREAVALDPGDAGAWAALGTNLLRRGDEAEGLEALRKAWDRDHFDVRTFNTLNLYEKHVAREYETLSHGPFRIRWPKSEAKLLARYVPALLDRAWATFVARYGFTPEGPIGVELYDTREQFSVRTSGLPNVGIEGVCFGRTVVAMTPRAGPGNWGNVLWHELAHVFAIQLSKSRVPRWFTEGLSEWETIAHDPTWDREEDPSFYVALRADRIPSLLRLNRAFTHAEQPRDVLTAYYAASRAQSFLADTGRSAKIPELLRLWGAGAKTDEVVRRGLGVDAAALDREFRAWARARLARYDAQVVPDDHAPPLAEARARAQLSPGDARAQVELALASVRARKPDEATAAVAAALALDPLDRDALLVDAELARARKDPDGARAKVLAMIRGGLDGYTERMLLATMAVEAKQPELAAAELRVAASFDPSSVEPLRALLDLARKRGAKAEELPLLRGIAALEQHDRAIWAAYLDALVAAGAWDELVRAGEHAVFVDPESAKVHAAWAKALAAKGERARAQFEEESAKLCEDARGRGHGATAATEAPPSER